MGNKVRVIVLAGLPKARPRRSNKMAGRVRVIVLAGPVKGKTSEEHGRGR
ncbi:MAG: hypothetical protein MUO24_11160 [Desulfobacterales bacterium]|nr:hypothetical protein [Desulfobacterales bacterium]